MLATLETGVPVWACDAARVGAELELRPEPPHGRLVLADAAGPVAVLFSAPLPERAPTRSDDRAAADRRAGAGRPRPLRGGGALDYYRRAVMKPQRPRLRRHRPPARARLPGGRAGRRADASSSRYGPIDIAPGQNNIEIERNDIKPPVAAGSSASGPTSLRRDGSVPRVDVIHLHHGVWLVSGVSRLFAAGEEKTRSSRRLRLALRARTTAGHQHMIHNLTPTPDRGVRHLRDRLHPRQRRRRRRG